MQKKFLNNLSLWQKYAVSLLIYLFLLLTITLSINYISDATNATNEIKTKANTMIELATLASIDPLWNYNSAASVTNGEALMKDKEICLVEIKDITGNYIYQKSKDSVLTLPKNMLVLENDILKDGKSLGRIKIGITKYYREKTLIEGLIKNIILTTLLAIIIGIVITYFITRSITKPINKIVSKLTEGATQVTAASNQLATASQQLSEGSAEQACSIEETSSTLQESASMLQQNNANTKQTAQLSEYTKKAAEKGNLEMQDLMNAMNKIKKSSDQIAKVIKVIDDIAFQTNILALNAAIEAARAGEAGMGFAVVAEEVRNLAQRSAQAAKDTTVMIETNIELSANGVSLTEGVRAALSEITTQAKKVNELMDEIAMASQEQSQGIEQVSKAIAQMETVTQQNASNSEESASASEELSAQAQNLHEIIQQLSKLVNGKSAKKLSHSAYQEVKYLKMSAPNNIEPRIQDNRIGTRPYNHNTHLPERNRLIKVVSPEDVVSLEKDNKF